MPDKSILIIGAGIAGLSAGCYGQMNGYRTRILEMHDRPGGLCTAWQRQGYTIDGCLHWLIGSGPESSYYRIWEELGATQGRRFIQPEAFSRLELPGAPPFSLYADLDRLQEHMLERAPDERETIRELVEGARAFCPADMPIDPASGSAETLPFTELVRRWGRMTFGDWVAKIQNPALRTPFSILLPGPMPMFLLLLVLSHAHRKAAGYPIGGSLEFSRAIERRYLDLGGEIEYRARVAQILVRGDRAVGVRLADGSEYQADVVISAADGRTTIFSMLEGRYTDEALRHFYDHTPIIPAIVQVSLGVGLPLADAPSTTGGTLFPVAEPVEVGPLKLGMIVAQVFSHDPTVAPAGKTVVRVSLPGDYAYWRALRETPDRYRAEKERIADQVVAGLDQRFPGLAAHVEMRDVATPVTFERYTGNWQGSSQGWVLTEEGIQRWLPGAQSSSDPPSKTLPGLKDFYMAGQWVEPGGGVPTAATTARQVIQMICREDGRPFGTTVP